MCSSKSRTQTKTSFLLCWYRFLLKLAKYLLEARRCTGCYILRDLLSVLAALQPYYANRYLDSASLLLGCVVLQLVSNMEL
jgi:hypothetical protein